MAGRGPFARSLFGMRPTASPGDFFYMMADSAAMASQYGHKQVLCQAMALANPSTLSLFVFGFVFYFFFLIFFLFVTRNSTFF
jgi:hypothetical protein